MTLLSEPPVSATGSQKAMATELHPFPIQHALVSLRVDYSLVAYSRRAAAESHQGSPTLCRVHAVKALWKKRRLLMRYRVGCRCVVVMGMPFPNPTDPELCERMRYLDASANHPADPLQPEGQLQ